MHTVATIMYIYYTLLHFSLAVGAALYVGKKPQFVVKYLSIYR